MTRLLPRLHRRPSPRSAGITDRRREPTPVVITGICVLLLLLFPLTVPTARGADTAPAAVVLVLNSYHFGYSWSDNEMAGIAEAFRSAPRHYELRTEYLDTKFFPRMELFAQEKALLARKCRGLSIRVVIAADNPALQFALTYRDELFPDAAVVFCGINGFEPAMIAGKRNVTGVAERLNTPDTVALALSLHPETREIFVVHDFTSTGLATRREAEADLAPFASQVRIRFMDDLGTADMLRHVRELRRGSIVLALSYSRDRDGIVYDHTRIARLLGENSPVPVYGTHEERIGYGIVGGSLLGGRMQGSEAAGLALRILGGEDPARIPVVTKSPTRVMFDFRQLARFGISRDSLPGGATVVNEPESFYRRYRRLVWTAVGAGTGLLVIIFLLSVNLTLRRRSEEVIAQKAAELDQANRELQEFNVLAYHNLQEPLRAIGGFVQLLERKYRGRLDEQADEYIGFVVQGVSRMKLLFSDFLAYTRLARSEAEETAPVELDLVVDMVREKLREAIGSSGARIIYEPLPRVRGSAVQLALLMEHLIENAIKFRSLAPPEIRVSSLPEGDRFRVSISDNGIGIEPAYHERIFQIFVRLHPLDRFPGTGIGLALCRKIVAHHDGRIWVESLPGRGTTFHFTLKRATLDGTHHRQEGDHG